MFSEPYILGEKRRETAIGMNDLASNPNLPMNRWVADSETFLFEAVITCVDQPVID